MLIKRFFSLIGAFVLFILALIGFLMPIIPGWPFLLIGFILISPKNGKNLLDKIKTKLKNLRKKK